MRNSNRYTALSDDNVYGNAEEDIEIHPPSTEQSENPSGNADRLAGNTFTHSFPSSRNDKVGPSTGDGWGDDLDLVDIEENYSDETTFQLIENSERCCKVSQGQRNSEASKLGFDPTQMTLLTPRAGRGGGLRRSSVTSHGPLQPIAESTLESEVEAGITGSQMVETVAEGDTTIIMQTTEPPPEHTWTTEQTFFTFWAQLIFGLNTGRMVAVPALFRDWVKNTSKHVPNFGLLPFNDKKGQVIATPEQVPDENSSFYKEYYHNHRVLRSGNLTGMVHFRCSVSWTKIKRMQDDCFQWLHWNKVYLNMAKFKCDTLVVCGFLVGAHPGHLRREDAEQEYRHRHKLPEDNTFNFPPGLFQLPCPPLN